MWVDINSTVVIVRLVFHYISAYFRLYTVCKKVCRQYFFHILQLIFCWILCTGSRGKSPLLRPDRSFSIYISFSLQHRISDTIQLNVKYRAHQCPIHNPCKEFPSGFTVVPYITTQLSFKEKQTFLKCSLLMRMKRLVWGQRWWCVK